MEDSRSRHLPCCLGQQGSSGARVLRVLHIRYVAPVSHLSPHKKTLKVGLQRACAWKNVGVLNPPYRALGFLRKNQMPPVNPQSRLLGSLGVRDSRLHPTQLLLSSVLRLAWAWLEPRAELHFHLPMWILGDTLKFLWLLSTLSSRNSSAFV